ncbi:cysteine hydrolase family protein [Microbacterium aurantiacum]|uniref:cysteine hydrolase family protein n=1 Tax=Microbacterium aurantiacum TaxID=162393 RepID=UPI000C80FD6C|nr:isochorismatase family protein [Microbacterium aurantiacum]
MTDAAGTSTGSAPWLVVIDPQAIFASADSAWGSPFFADAMPRIRFLAEIFGDRVLVTRWMPTADRSTSWGAYFSAWPFADQSPSDALFDLVPEAQSLSTHPTLDLPTFGKWGPELEAIVGRGANVVLAGVSTDCCVISTALAAADAGAFVTVAADACAGSTAENHAAAIHVMGLYPPQITVSDTAAILAAAASLSP